MWHDYVLWDGGSGFFTWVFELLVFIMAFIFSRLYHKVVTSWFRKLWHDLLFENRDMISYLKIVIWLIILKIVTCLIIWKLWYDYFVNYDMIDYCENCDMMTWWINFENCDMMTWFIIVKIVTWIYKLWHSNTVERIWYNKLWHNILYVTPLCHNLKSVSFENLEFSTGLIIRGKLSFIEDKFG